MPSRLARCVHVTACALVAAVIFSCTDQTGPPTQRQSGLPLRPHYVVLGADSSLPINHVRITARNKANGDTVGVAYLAVSPDSASWNIKMELQTGGLAIDVEFLIELVNENANGVQQVEWTGTLSAHVSPSQTTSAPLVDVYRGPPENLTITSVAIDEPLPEMAEGDATTLHATLSGPANARVYWSSLDPGVASITVDGALSANLPGHARIIAVAGPKADTVTIAVAQKLTGLLLTPSSGLLEAIGGEFTYSAKGVDKRGDEIAGTSIGWKTSDSTVAALVGVGRFRAMSNGSATITIYARTNASIQATGTMMVRQRPATVKIDRDDISFEAIGAQQQLTTRVLDANGHAVPGTPVAWSSSNEAVARVDAAGLVTALGAGSATIRAQADTAHASIKVEVEQVESALEVVPDEVTFVSLRDTVRLHAVAVDANGNEVPQPNVTWSSIDSRIATVDANGLVTAIGNGTVVIAAVLQNLRAFATVTILQAVTKIDITPADPVLTTFSPLQLYAMPLDASGNVVDGLEVEWESSDTTIAKIDDDGLVTPLKNGSVVIDAEAGEIHGATSLTINVPVTERFEIISGNNQRSKPGMTLAQPLVVRMTDASGHGISGRYIGWVVTSGGGSLTPTLSVTDTGGYARAYWTVGSLQGTHTAEARFGSALVTLPPLQFSATVDVLPTATITWRGSVSSSWNDTANWTPARLPVTTDTVLIPRNTTWTSQFNSEIQLGAFIVEPGATFLLNGWIWGSRGVFGDIPGTGGIAVGSSGGDAFMAGNFPSLQFFGPTHLVGRVNTGGSVAVNVPLTLDGNALNVAGNLTVESGTLVMQHPADSLSIRGNAAFYYSAPGNTLAAGVIRVGGDFTAGCGAAFNAYATTVVLDGSSNQTIYLGGDCDFDDVFADMIVSKPSGSVIVDYGSVPVRNLHIQTPTQFVAAGGWCNIWSEGDVTAVTGSTIGCSISTAGAAGTSLIHGTLTDGATFRGRNQVISSALDYARISIMGSAHTDGPISTPGELTLQGDTASLTLGGSMSSRTVSLSQGSSLELAGHSMDVHGSVWVDRGSTFTMTSAADQLNIIGDSVSPGGLFIGYMYGDPGSDFTGKLTAGTITLTGNLTSSCGVQPGFMSDGTKVVFAGHTPQSLQFVCASGPITTQYLKDVDIKAGASVNLGSRIVANGNLDQHGVLSIGSVFELYVDGAVHLYGGSNTNNMGTFRTNLSTFVQDSGAVYTGTPPVSR